MPDVSVRMPGPGWGGGLNAFLDAYERGQDRSMAQGQNQALMELRAMQMERERRGVAKDATMEALRQALAQAPDTEIPLAAERTVARPYTAPELATATEAAGLGVPPPPQTQPTETVPGQTMRGLTQAGALGGLADPRLKAALLTPEGQAASKARGVLTERDLRARRAFAESQQESQQFAVEARDAADRGDAFELSSKMAALYQRQAALFAESDPARAQDMRTRSETYYGNAVLLQADKQERALQDADLKGSGAALTKLSAPGGATVEHLAEVLNYDWKSKHGQAVNWDLHRAGIDKAVARLAETDYRPLMAAVLAEMDAQPGRRDPQAAYVAAVAKLGPQGLELAARGLADKGTFGQWNREMFGGKGTKESDYDVARRMVMDPQGNNLQPGQPGFDLAVGVRLQQIRHPSAPTPEEHAARAEAWRLRQEKARLDIERGQALLDQSREGKPAKPETIGELSSAGKRYGEEARKLAEEATGLRDQEKTDALKMVKGYRAMQRQLLDRAQALGGMLPAKSPAPATRDRETRRIAALGRARALAGELRDQFQGDALKAEIKRRLLAEGFNPDEL